MEGQTHAPPNGWNGPEEKKASCSAPSHSPSQSPGKKVNAWLPQDSVLFGNPSYLDWRRSSYPTTPTCLAGACGGGHVLWQQGCPHRGNSDGPRPGHPILWNQLLGEGLSLGKVWDTVFTLSGALSWVGKLVGLNANALSLWEGRQLITQAITKWCPEARGPGHPHSCLSVSLLFRFHIYNWPPQEERLQSTDKHVEEPRHTHWALHHDWASQHD